MVLLIIKWLQQWTVFETMSMNSNKTCRLRNRHNFSACAWVSSADGLAAVKAVLKLKLMHVLSCSYCSVPLWTLIVLWVPHVLCCSETKGWCQHQHHHQTWRKPSRSCWKSRINRGVKWRTVLIWQHLFILHFFKLRHLFFLFSIPASFSSLPQFFNLAYRVS